VFLYIGGEGPQGPVTDKLFMWQLAEENNALMIALEHRFYGESYPTKDMSNPNLVYLTSSQALADLARFIEYVSGLSSDSGAGELSKASPPLKVKADLSSSKWVSFGGSYPGNLATWLKLKYPSSVAGTVGSSAPVKGDYNYYK
jgi:serine protease 16